MSDSIARRFLSEEWKSVRKHLFASRRLGVVTYAPVAEQPFLEKRPATALASQQLLEQAFRESETASLPHWEGMARAIPFVIEISGAFLRRIPKWISTMMSFGYWRGLMCVSVTAYNPNPNNYRSSKISPCRSKS